jgi:hypothetical protein
LAINQKKTNPTTKFVAKKYAKRYVLFFIDTKKIITSSKTYAYGLKILSDVNLDLCTVLDMIQKK